MELRCIFCLLFIVVNSKRCKSPNGIVCCPGFKLRNETGDDCIPCYIGFYGPNCAIPCYYPSFGKDCQFECSCKKEICDHVHGCLEIKDSTDFHTKHFKDVNTTLISTERTSSERTFVTLGLPHIILYITMTFIGLLTMLCCVFVSAYIYKHCGKNVTIARGKGDDNTARYSCLGVNTHHQNEHSSDPSYLEPVTISVSHYEQIIDQSDKDDSSNDIVPITYENENNSLSNTSNMFPHSKSFPCPPTDNKTTIRQNEKKICRSNSL